MLLNRPDRRNAFGVAMRDGLIEALDVAVADPTVTIALRGAGPTFCSGGDLDEFGTTPDPATAHLIRLERSVADRIFACRDRVTAHLHGACIGAGIELAAFADRVRAAPDTEVRLPEVAMGLIPGAGGRVSIVRRIGRGAMWLTGRPEGPPLQVLGAPADVVEEQLDALARHPARRGSVCPTRESLVREQLSPAGLAKGLCRSAGLAEWFAAPTVGWPCLWREHPMRTASQP